MDKEGENSSSAEAPYAPATPGKPGRSDPAAICGNGSRNQLHEAVFRDIPERKSFSCWEGNLGSLNDINGGMYNGFSMDNVNTWHTISCRDLLALADATIVTNGSGGSGGGGGGGPMYLSDLNEPPQALTESLLSLGLSSQFTPVTPDQAGRAGGRQAALDNDEGRTNQPDNEKERLNLEEQPRPEAGVSTLVEVNIEKGLTAETNLNETPQPKQRRRKHRPKVVTEGKPKRVRKPATPKPEGSSTGKRKYVRKKVVEKPETSGTIDPITDQQTVDKSKSCKRKLEFDEPKQGGEVEVTIDKSKADSADQTVETYPIPITPVKTDEGLMKDARRSYTKTKYQINFMHSPNESNSSTSESFKKGEHSKKTNEIRVCCESLEAYLSMYTDYNSVMHIPAIYKKTRIEKCQKYEVSHTSMEARAVDFQVSIATKKRMKKNQNHMGCHLNSRWKCVCDIDALVNQFEQLSINNRVAEKNKGVLVPFSSRYLEKNALVVYQRDGSLVPYEGLFNPIKKRKPRPKVDLDDETSRVWRLLLEDINSQGVDGTDEDKAKWWEEERRVFRGRTDSFIARMHLVQGDRRFSRWKGSVLDSVVGVFLTQNVSDHLSSSAFMSLAARFPLKSNSSSEPLQEEPPILSVKESCQEQCSVIVQHADSCEVIGESEKDLVMYKELVIDQIEIDEIVSSQNSADASPSSVQSSVAYSSGEQEDRSNKKMGQEELESMAHSQGENDSSNTTCELTLLPNAGSLGASEVECFELSEETKIVQKKREEKCASEESGLSAESATHATVKMVITSSHVQEVLDVANVLGEASEAAESNNIVEASKVVEFSLNGDGSNQVVKGMDEGSSEVKRVKNGKAKEIKVEWDNLRLQAEIIQKRERTPDTMDSLDYEAVRSADVSEVADAIKERGMNNVLAGRIKDVLDRLVREHGSIDLEWLRDVPPDKAKEYLLSFRGLGLKSVECVRLLTLHHLAFPVDTNVGRIAVRLGWVPLQPLPESLQLHLLELYPVLESIQKYLWPRLCKLDQRTLYELHYQMITFGKVFCTKSKPNCNACPMRGDCRHFASAFASARLGLPAPEEKRIVSALENKTGQNAIGMTNQQHLTLPPANEQLQQQADIQICNPVIEEPATPDQPIVEVPATQERPIVEVPATPDQPIVEVPATPEPEQIQQEFDIEDFGEDPEEIPMIKLNIEEFTQNLQTYMERHMELGEVDMSRALVALTSEAASIPTPKLKNVSQLRTEHQVYELPDSHPLLEGLDRREPDDPCSYLLAIWTPGETADSIQPPGGQCSSQESGTLCNEETCFFCNSTREANSQTVRGTLLIPCRTATRGSFPLNGTYFQVNEVFADHESSLNPIDVPRSWLWSLPRRIVYFGTSIPTIFKGLTTEDIQYCFWRGFVCVRGFDQKTRAPRPLMARLHFPASRLKRSREKADAN